jgi:hypothetical protein
VIVPCLGEEKKKKKKGIGKAAVQTSKLLGDGNRARTIKQ